MFMLRYAALLLSPTLTQGSSYYQRSWYLHSYPSFASSSSVRKACASMQSHWFVQRCSYQSLCIFVISFSSLLAFHPSPHFLIRSRSPLSWWRKFLCLFKHGLKASFFQGWYGRSNDASVILQHWVFGWVHCQDRKVRSIHTLSLGLSEKEDECQWQCSW